MTHRAPVGTSGDGVKPKPDEPGPRTAGSVARVRQTDLKNREVKMDAQIGWGARLSRLAAHLEAG